MDIIGVVHLNKYLPHIEDYIRKNYTQGSLMLELEPGQKPECYFGFLEDKLKDDWKIIHGDKYHSVDSKTVKFRARIKEIENKVIGQDAKGFISNREAFAAMGYLLSAPIKQKVCSIMDAFNPKLISKRNEGLYETLKEYSPDVSIVGAAHAFAIKREMPHVYFKLFLVDTPVHHMSLFNDIMYSKIYKTTPNEIIWYPRNLQ